MVRAVASKKEKNLEKGFLKSRDELPGFGEGELKEEQELSTETPESEPELSEEKEELEEEIKEEEPVPEPPEPPEPEEEPDIEEESDLEQENRELEEEIKKQEEKLEKEPKPEETKPKKIEVPFEIVHGVIRATCIVALVVWFILIVLLSIATLSDPFNTFMGLSPVLLTIIITYILVDKYHLESGFLLIFPFIFTAILYVLGTANLLSGIDYRNLSSVNIIFGLIFEVVVIIHYAILKHREKKKAA